MPSEGVRAAPDEAHVEEGWPINVSNYYLIFYSSCELSTCNFYDEIHTGFITLSTRAVNKMEVTWSRVNCLFSGSTISIGVVDP